MVSLVAFLFVIGVLIFVHELGHFLVAKAVGIAVPRFSIGLGPATPLRFRRGETEYLIAWIPFGGYVKMASHEEQQAMEALEGGPTDEVFPPHRLFENKPLWARILVISAGVVMNALFAWLVYSGLGLVYGRTEDPTTTVARVEAAALPEAARPLAEIPFGTRIEKVNGQPVDSWNDILTAVTDITTPSLTFDLDSGGPLTLDVPGTDARARVAIADALVPLWPARIDEVVPNEPAAQAGLRRGDRITAADGQEIRAWNELVQVIETHPGKPLTLTVERDGAPREVVVLPAERTVPDPQTGEERSIGRIGITPQHELVRTKLGLVDATVQGARQTWSDAVMILYTLKGMILGRISHRELGGPLFIGQVSGEVARRGFDSLLVFMALLSVNLAVLNLLPIPVLDGGHLVFLLLEGVRGKPLPTQLRMRLTQAGLYVLLGLMVLVIFNDVLRIFST